MRPKIRENLRTANFNPKFTGYKKSVIDMEMCADSLVFVLQRLDTLITRLPDWYFFLNAVNEKWRRLPTSNLRELRITKLFF